MRKLYFWPCLQSTLKLTTLCVIFTQNYLSKKYIVSVGLGHLIMIVSLTASSWEVKIQFIMHTWIASSLVGQITITPVPFLGKKWELQSSSIAGTRKARVFPEPVLAEPITSLCSIRCGIDLAWICSSENNHAHMPLLKSNSASQSHWPHDAIIHRNTQLHWTCQKYTMMWW